MSEFVPSQSHVREVLLFYFNLKKNAPEGHRMLFEAYGNQAPSISTCEDWFRRFEAGDFDAEDKEPSGEQKKIEDKDLKALLEDDPCKTQEEYADLLGVTQETISIRLKNAGMIQKLGQFVPYELKPRDIERRLVMCEMLLQRKNRKGFLHNIVTGGKKWIHYDNTTSTSTAQPNIHGSKVLLCIWWDQLGVVYYELLEPNVTIDGDSYRLQLMCLSRALRENRLEYEERHHKVILQHDNARPHVAETVKTYLETLKWEVLPHAPYSPDLAPSDYYLFPHMSRDMAEQRFTCYDDVKKWVDSWIATKDRSFFRDGIAKLPERWEKVAAIDGQYFE